VATTLADHLLRHKAALLEEWWRSLLASYPPDTACFLARQKDPFANPVGQTMAPALARLLDLLIEGAGEDDLKAPLDEIIRIRAVQDFSAGQAVCFLFALKDLIRHKLPAAIDVQEGPLRDLERRIDRAGLLAFDLYMSCRERIYEIRASELRNRTALLLKRHCGIVELPDESAVSGPTPLRRLE
jgi:hypothetical protein